MALVSHRIGEVDASDIPEVVLLREEVIRDLLGILVFESPLLSHFESLLEFSAVGLDQLVVSTDVSFLGLG
jgi:hypothetical protein